MNIRCNTLHFVSTICREVVMLIDWTALYLLAKSIRLKTSPQSHYYPSAMICLTSVSRTKIPAMRRRILTASSLAHLSQLLVMLQKHRGLDLIPITYMHE